MADAIVALSNSTALVVSTGRFGIPLTARYQKTHGGLYHLYAIAYQNVDQQFGFYGQLSGYSFTARTGVQVVGDLPTPTFTASGTVTSLARFVGTMPMPTFVGHAIVTALGQAQLELSGYSFRAHSGAIARFTGPRATVTAHAKTGTLASFYGVAPSPTLTAHATSGSVATLIAVLPTLQVAPSGATILRFPRATLRAHAYNSTAATYEGYSVAMFENDRGMQLAVTRYTEYPFTRIVRFGSTYYGVAADGLFELAGETFNSVPIVSVLRTGETDFGAREMKRPVSMYIAGRVSGDFRVSVQEAEVKEYTYAFHPVNKTGARNYRVFFGKGMRARYLTYTLTNINGENFELDELTPEVAVLRRTA